MLNTLNLCILAGMSTLETRCNSQSAVTMKDAEKALSRYVRQGYKNCEPHNPAHQRMYLQLRATCARADGQTFLTFLNSNQQSVVIGAKAETKHWAVPKANFPAGLPQDIEEAIVDEEQLALNWRRWVGNRRGSTLILIT